jgi:hypothetical protein
MGKSHKDQEARTDRKINMLKKEGLNVGMPDRHYRHIDAESPDTDNLDDHDPIVIANDANKNENCDKRD